MAAALLPLAVASPGRVAAVASPAVASSDAWASAWCSSSTKFDDAYEKADDLGNSLYQAVMSGKGGIAALKRKLAAAATAARKAATAAASNLADAGVPATANGADLQASAVAAFEAAAKAMQQAGAKLENFDPSDPKGTVKALRASGSRGACGQGRPCARRLPQ